MKKRLLAIIMAMAMLFTVGVMTACNGNDGPEQPGDTTTPDTSGQGSGEPPDMNAGPDEWVPEGDEFNFGVFRFSPRTMRIPSAATIIVGGNMGAQTGWANEGGGASCAIRIFGFQGWSTGRPPEGFPDYGFGDYVDNEGQYQTMFSQHGPFWENIARIEVDFYLEGVGDTEPDDIGNIETIIQHGEIGRWNFFQPAGNLLETVIDEEADKGFEWGDVISAVWDFDDFRERDGIKPVFCWDTEVDIPQYILDIPAEDGKGGGVLKFGLQIQNADPVELFITVEIHFEDVNIYVYDKEEFLAQIAAVEEITGVEVSQEMLDRIHQVEA
jgi:hypothetical protein